MKEIYIEKKYESLAAKPVHFSDSNYTYHQLLYRDEKRGEITGREVIKGK